MTKKKRKFPTLRYERIIYARYCVIMRKNYLRHYAKELFAPDERFICTTMRKNYLRSHRSQHSLDIFPGQEAEGGSLFLVTYLFLHRNKKVNTLTA